jgi:glucokinase
MTEASALVGDIGGTNARFALVRSGVACNYAAFGCAGYPSLSAAVNAYLHAQGLTRAPPVAALAVAAPIDAEPIRMTNSHWEISRADLLRDFAFTALHVENDFAALARSIPRLAAGDSLTLGPRAPTRAGPMGVLGPGTGLGTAALVPGAEGWTVICGEGGHVTLAAESDAEWALLGRLRARYGHVSAERVLSGAGLAELHRCIAPADRGLATPAEVIAAARAGNGDAQRALEFFFAWLGAVAGNLALTLGASGGVFLGGGILPRVRAELLDSPFRDRFVAKGRFTGYLDRIGTALIVHPHPTLLGLLAALEPPSLPP